MRAPTPTRLPWWRPAGIPAACAMGWSTIALLLPRTFADPDYVPGAGLGEEWLRGDWDFFVRLGERAMAGDFAGAFQRERNAAGPAQVISDALLARAASFGGGGAMAAWLFFVAFLLAVAWFTRCAWRGLGVVSRSEPGWAVYATALGAVVLVLQAPGMAIAWGHPWQMLVLVAWAGAGLYASGQRHPGWRALAAIAGAFAGAALFEPWALLGVPVVLLAPSWGSRLLAGAAAAAGGLLAAAPFLLLAAPSFQWRNGNGSATFWEALGMPAASGGLVRVAQAAVVVGAGAAFVFAARRWGLPPLLVATLAPAFIVAVRCAFEVTWWPYYLSAAGAVCCAAGLAGVLSRAARWPGGVLAVVSLACLPGLGAQMSPYAASGACAAGIAVAAFGYARAARETSRAPMPAP